jgi:hypothetical protein
MKGYKMTVISVKQDNQAIILNEDNEFVCAHLEAYVENPQDAHEAMWICDQCDMYSGADVDGIDDEGHLEYRTPDMWEWQ